MVTVLVVGGGGREHALAWCLADAAVVDRILVAPGNAGTAIDARIQNAPVLPDDIDGIVRLAGEESVDLVVVGPEGPLAMGLVDRLDESGFRAFGPTATAARLESSKIHSKSFMERHAIPTGRAEAFDDAESALAHLAVLEVPPVVKASGLAAGKGVVIPETHDEAEAAVRQMMIDRRFGRAGDQILLEERLDGPEMSVLAFCDGETFRVMPAAQDHKRLRDHDRGPNTGGMGAFVPSPLADAQLIDEIGARVIGPTLDGLAAEGSAYRGVLYVGVMITADGPKVLEYNCRFGDPETQVVLPLLQSDPVEVMTACIEGRLDQIDVSWRPDAAVTVVLASKGYPDHPSDPAPIHGLTAAADLGCTVFHAGSEAAGDEIMAVGGRVLGVTAVAPTLSAAAEMAHLGADAIDFAGCQRRRDIARVEAS